MRRALAVVLVALFSTCRPFDEELGRTLERLADAGVVEAGADAGVDAGVDASVDAGVDAGVEDAGAADAGEDAGVRDAGPRCVVKSSLPATQMVSPTAAPSVGAILNGFFVTAPGVSSATQVYKYSDGMLSAPATLGCAGPCIGAKLPRATSAASSAVIAWSSAAAFSADVQVGGVPILAPSSGYSCSPGTVVNGDVLADGTRAVGCTGGFVIRNGIDGGLLFGASGSTEVRFTNTEAGEAMLAWLDGTNVNVARYQPEMISPLGVTHIAATPFRNLGFDVGPGGDFLLAGSREVAGSEVLAVFEPGDDGGLRSVSTGEQYVSASTAAPLGVAIGATGALVVFEAVGGGVYALPRALDGGWERLFPISTTGHRPAVAADRSEFAVAFVGASGALVLSTITCEP